MWHELHLLFPVRLVAAVEVHHTRPRSPGRADDPLQSGHPEPRAATAAALTRLLRQLHLPHTGHGHRGRAAGPRPRLGRAPHPRDGGGAYRHSHPREGGGMDGSAGRVQDEHVRQIQRDDGELAEVRRLRVQLRVGEGGGGAERDGAQARWQGDLLPGVGGRRKHGLGDLPGAAFYECVGGRRGVHERRQPITGASVAPGSCRLARCIAVSTP
ncbi:Transferase family [Musa troglodytarum]|uniref:Transferase family n=1 Tax=Musa troglodytarum TaxID=320322 RepID=A0A9E7GRU6_9LILI|nr:Transferase family [Musa troglodytarum]